MDGYFDYNASAPLLPEAAEVLVRLTGDLAGNPASPHAPGRRARACLEDARERIAALIACRPAELVFTSGGTESDNLAVLGAARARRSPERRRIVVSAVEHPAVLEPARRLEEDGFFAVIVPVTEEGVVAIPAYREALDPRVCVASLMLANNETGAIQPVAAAAAAARKIEVPFHCDAVQALGRVPVEVDELGVDLLSGSSHKVGGPRGVGFLFLRQGCPLHPILAGGSQEHGLRPGTPAPALAAAFATALEISVGRREEEARRLGKLRDRLEQGLRGLRPDLVVNGPQDRRLPNTLNVMLPGAPADEVVMALDRAGIAASTGSACASGAAAPSHVLAAMGCSREHVSASLRLSIGAGTTGAGIGGFLEAMAAVFQRLDPGTNPPGYPQVTPRC